MVRPLSFENRRGSALLIVLGMVAFMVISAVAFSAYMRFSRLPSSYLRRAISSRMLLQAALANAIDEVDAAIANNPHPGVGTKARMYPMDGSGTSRNRNWWMGRVYIGTNLTSMVAQSETVSPLSLEGLAYIPAPLVNEARYYSRHSLSARWHTLPYDSGRYAFCAIDVSDYFDVNAIGADQARSSHADSRVSLGYLFENVDHTAVEGTWVPDDWDKMMSDAYKTEKVPMVSVADLNLSINELKPNGMTTPFCEYVNNSYLNFYNSPSDDAKEQIRRMMFMTDSYFPKTTGAETSKVYYLDDENSQPFGRIAEGRNALSIINDGIGSARASVWKHYLSPLGLCALYDYLDYDSVPCSLALPTTERVPMVCGIQPVLPSMTLQVNPTTTPIQKTAFTPTANPNIEECTVTYSVIYSLDPATFMGLSAAKLKTLMVYPFRHDATTPPQFNVEGWISLFLTSGNMGLRTGSLNDALHYSGNLLAANTYQVGQNNNAVISIPFAQQPVSITPQDESSALKEILLNASAPSSIAGDIAQRKLVEITFSGTQQKIRTPNAMGSGYTETFSPTDEQITSNPLDPALAQSPCNAQVNANSDFIPLNANGVQDPQFVGSALQNLLNGTTPVSVKLNAAVWVRVKNANDKTVDLVPACLSDDPLLGIYPANPQIMMVFDNTFFGNVFPLLRFDTGAAIEYGNGAVATPTPMSITLSPAAAYVGDPRYNHAPENWFAASGVTAADWLTACHAHDSYRDGDIFMSVSDQGYLQSIYELANLPRFTQFYRSGANYGLGATGSELYYKPESQYTGTTIPNTFEDTAHRHLMWRTYDPFPRSGKYYSGGNWGNEFAWNADGDIFDPTLDDPSAECFLAPEVGYGINPYSDSTNHVMAALANTPHEWRFAGTNEQATVMQGVPFEGCEFNPKYAWNEYSSGARIQWPDLEKFAGIFMEELRRSPADADITNLDADWKEVWDGLPWRDPATTYASTDELCGEQLGDTSNQGKLYNCDKKFLYGYWRDCFAVKQQLFLIFVRAEPAMMGGESNQASPPQLGAKAVALVWRNPSGIADPLKPHQTRVLFYRQFE